MTKPVAIVTGASSGIGRAVAVAMAERGFDLVVIARRKHCLDDLAEQLSDQATCHAIVGDLLNEMILVTDQLDAIVSETARIDVLINAAGQGLLKPFAQQTDDDLSAQLRLHYLAPAALIRWALPHMMANRRGHVINIASIAAKVGPWGHAGYAAAKAALATMTKTLAAEHRELGIHFSCVYPGIVDTEFFDEPTYESLAKQVKRHAVSSERVAKRIMGLMDKPRPEMTIPGHYRFVDFLSAIAPGLVNRRIASQSKPPDAD